MLESAKRVAEKKDWIKGATGDWEIVLGLEVHAQVLAKSKLFSGASAEFGGAPNDHVSLVDAAMPGMLPSLHALKLATTQVVQLMSDACSCILWPLAVLCEYYESMHCLQMFS